MTPGIKLQLELTPHPDGVLELRALLGIDQLIAMQGRTDIVLLAVKGILESIVAPHGKPACDRIDVP